MDERDRPLSEAWMNLWLSAIEWAELPTLASQVRLRDRILEYKRLLEEEGSRNAI
jgi:hypothetical protein